MALTFEQFKQLRAKGLTAQQIADFERGVKPQSTMNTQVAPQPQKQSFLSKAGGVFAKAGEMFLNPTINAIQTGIMQPIREVQSAIPGGKTGREVYKTPFGENKNVRDLSLGQKIMQPIDVATAGLPVEQIVKKPLTLIAEKLYQSALKPGNVKVAGKIVTKADELVKIGLNERVWLTKGGVEKVANRIDDFENMIGEVIENAKSKGAVDVNKVRSYVDEAKKFFQNQANVPEAKKALQEIDEIGKAFRKEYGAFMSLKKAQEIKVATGQSLKKYYDRMTSAGIEATKQLTRGLKEQIVEKAPQMGAINQRLSNLYKFDQALTKASGRIGNLNLMGLPSKITGGLGGAKGFVVGKLLELADAPAIKSGVAINLDRLASAGNKTLKGVKVPLASLITHVIDEINKQKND